MLIGVFSGTYSSIFIASHWLLNLKIDLGARKRSREAKFNHKLWLYLILFFWEWTIIYLRDLGFPRSFLYLNFAWKGRSDGLTVLGRWGAYPKQGGEATAATCCRPTNIASYWIAGAGSG
jgi:hypothetical protein